MKALKWSIGLRLTLWYLLIFALAQCIFGIGMYVVLRHHLRTIVNDGLRQEMKDLENVLQGQRPDIDVVNLSEEVNEAYAQDHAGQYLQIFTTRGESIYVSPFMTKHPLPLVADSALPNVRFDDRTLEGKRFRFLNSSVNAHGRTFLVQLGTPTGEIFETLRAFRRYLLMLAPLLLLVAALGGNWLSHLALAPVDAITRTAQTINATNLSRRLQSPETGDELQRLSETLNEMLARIEAAMLRITEFTADASHELRTPVALIRAEAEVALGRERTVDEYRAALQHVQIESERMTRLLEQMLALVRADSSSAAAQMAEFDLSALAHEAVESWQKVANSHGMKLECAFPTKPVPITGDSAGLRRVLDILLDNAVKYSVAPGAIAVNLSSNGSDVVLRVRDEGVGLPPDEREKIFERFYRVDKARSRQIGGAGLGLAIAQWIVQQHHGTITVESTPGKGAEFIVTLPTAQVRSI